METDQIRETAPPTLFISFTFYLTAAFSAAQSLIIIVTFPESVFAFVSDLKQEKENIFITINYWRFFSSAATDPLFGSAAKHSALCNKIQVFHSKRAAAHFSGFHCLFPHFLTF